MAYYPQHLQACPERRWLDARRLFQLAHENSEPEASIGTNFVRRFEPGGWSVQGVLAGSAVESYTFCMDYTAPRVLSEEDWVACVRALYRYVPLGACHVFAIASPKRFGCATWEDAMDGCAILYSCKNCIVAHKPASSHVFPEYVWERAQEYCIYYEIHWYDAVWMRQFGHALVAFPQFFVDCGDAEKCKLQHFRALSACQSAALLVAWSSELLPYRDLRRLVAQWVWATRYDDCWVLE